MEYAALTHLRFSDMGCVCCMNSPSLSHRRAPIVAPTLFREGSKC